MYKLCKTESSAMRQRELERQLLSMMTVLRYEEITVSDFCAQAQIPRKAFYRYFSSKDGALHALIDHTLLEIGNIPASSNSLSSQIYQRELVRFFRFWQSQKQLLDALERSGISGILVTRCIDYALAEYGANRRFRSNGELEMWEYATTFGVCGLMSMILNWHHNGYPLPPQQMAEIAVNLLTKPLFGNISE